LEHWSTSPPRTTEERIPHGVHRFAKADFTGLPDDGERPTPDILWATADNTPSENGEANDPQPYDPRSGQHPVQARSLACVVGRRRRQFAMLASLLPRSCLERNSLAATPKRIPTPGPLPRHRSTAPGGPISNRSRRPPGDDGPAAVDGGRSSVRRQSGPFLPADRSPSRHAAGGIPSALHRRFKGIWPVLRDLRPVGPPGSLSRPQFPGSRICKERRRLVGKRTASSHKSRCRQGLSEPGL